MYGCLHSGCAINWHLDVRLGEQGAELELDMHFHYMSLGHWLSNLQYAWGWPLPAALPLCWVGNAGRDIGGYNKYVLEPLVFYPCLGLVLRNAS